jgi:hypothetical protein
MVFALAGDSTITSFMARQTSALTHLRDTRRR